MNMGYVSFRTYIYECGKFETVSLERHCYGNLMYVYIDVICTKWEMKVLHI